MSEFSVWACFGIFLCMLIYILFLLNKKQWK